MSAGTPWQIPGGHRAIEMPGSTVDVLRLAVIPPGWPWPKPPQDVPRVLCTPLPCRYLHGDIDGE